MANTITDNRTSLTTCDALTGMVNLTGGGSGSLDAEVKIEGSFSVGLDIGSGLKGILYDTGSAQSWAGSTVYIWINCGIVGLLDTKANGGFRIRFTGASTVDWFEVYVGGSDSWPPAVSGGWVQFVVDVTTARADAVTNSHTNGTVPTTSQVQFVGWAGITGGSMPRKVDNCWMDQIAVLGSATPGIIIQGRNGGTTDWNSADIATQLGIPVGTFIPTTGGAYKVNTPIQIGVNDTVTHGFADTNALWLWDDQEFLPDTFYKITALGNVSGTTNIAFGSKTGTGVTATGAQGLIISAAAAGARWDIDFTDANLDSVGLYGCILVHGRDFLLNSASVEVISTTYLDGSSLDADNSLQQFNTIVNANTADSVAFANTADLGDFLGNSFEFSDGHAIEITVAGTYTLSGNKLVGYLGTPGTNLVVSSGSTDAAIYNSSAGLVTINVADSGDTPSIRNAAGSTTQVNNNISVTLTGMRDNTEVRVLDNTTKEFLAGIENATAGTADDRSFAFSLAAALVVDIAIFNTGYILPPNNRIENFTIPATDASLPVTQVVDRNYVNL